MKMINLGKKETSGPCEVSSDSKKGKTRICYPGFTIYDKVPEELFNRDVGDTVKAAVVMKMTSKGMDENGDRKSRRVSFDVLEIGVNKNESDLEKEIRRQTGTEEKEEE